MRTEELAPPDPRYPAALEALAQGGAPPRLYVRGALPAAAGVAVVGTRLATEPAIAFTRALVRGLVELGYSVWSGGARGVDAAAHEAALEAAGATVVVAGGGLGRPYPREHVPLYDAVLAAGGALVSRVPDDVAPRPTLFIQRNAVLAALTAATVVVEAGLQSGALSTAAAARRLGRPLCVVPHAPWAPLGAGCAQALAAGARAITCARDVARAIDEHGGAAPIARRAARPRSRAGASLPLPLDAGARRAALDRELTADEETILRALDARALHVEDVCQASGLPWSRVSGALLTLTLDAVVVEAPAGHYRRS